MAAVVLSNLLCKHASTAVVAGLDLAADGQMAAVSLAGDGAAVYDVSTQTLRATYPLGGAGRLDFVSAAVLDVHADTCTAILTDSQAASSTHKIVSWPASLRTKKQTNSKNSGTFSTVADVQQSVPLPSHASSLHILYPPSSSPSQPTGITAVALQDGNVSYSVQGAAQLSMASPTTLARLRASCCTSNKLYTLHQASPNAQVFVNEYAAVSSTSTGPMLQHIRSFDVPTPSHAALAQSIQASANFLLVTWSSGALTVVKCGKDSEPMIIQLQQHLAITAGATSANSTPAGSKRKASPSIADNTTATNQSLVSAGIVDATQIIIARLGHSLNTAQQPPELQYQLIDHQYGCTVASGSVNLEGVVLPLSGSKQLAFKLYSHPSVPGTMILQVGTSFSVLTFQTRPANLLALLGKLSVASNNKQDGSAPDTGSAGGSGSAAGSAAHAMNVPALIDMVISHTDNTAPVASDTATVHADDNVSDTLALQALPTDLANTVTKPASSQQIETLIQSLQAALSAGKPSVPAQLTQQASELILQHAKTVGSGNWVIYTQLAPLTIKALANNGKWDRLKQVLDTLQLQSLIGCGSVLTGAVAAGRFDLLPHLVARLDGVEAHELAETIKVVLASKGPAHQEAKKQYHMQLRAAAEAVIAEAEGQLAAALPRPAMDLTASAQDSDGAVQVRRDAIALAETAAAAVDGFSLTQVLLHPIFSLDQDPTALATALRQLTNRQVDSLMTYLAIWVDKYTHQLGNQAVHNRAHMLPYQLAFPSYDQVLEWVRLLLDAHLPRLLMATQQPDSLKKLLQLTQKQVQAHQMLLPLAGTVEHIRANAALPPVHNSVASQYVVQYIDLSVRAR